MNLLMLCDPCPQGLVMRVPMCCEKCITKVREALLDLPGVRDVICDQYEQKVIISGNVDPEQALRRLRRVKKKSEFWKEATQPLLYSASKSPELLHSGKALDTYVAPTTYTTSAYRAPVYTSSPNRAPLYTSPLIRQPSLSYARYISPPRRYTTSYSRAYSSPYIDSAYRSGYGETRYNHYNSAFDRYSSGNFHVDPSKGTPYIQMHDDY